MKGLMWLEENIEEMLLFLLLSGMVFIMGIQVCARYLFGYSLSWSEEITRYLFVWSGFISVSYCTRKCISIKVEQIVSMLPKRGKALCKLINHTMELVFFLYLLPFSFRYLMASVKSGEVSPACGIPMYVVQAAPFVSFLLVSVRIVQRWIIEFRIAKGFKKEETACQQE